MSTQRRRYVTKAVIEPDPFGFAHKAYARGSVRSRHKWNRDESAYCVANEVICAEIGRFIGLPIPHYSIAQAAEGELSDRYLFSSLDFNWDDRDLSPVIPDNCLRDLPKICAGVLVFDVLIANADRHDLNLAVDRSDKPRDMRVYDHDCALFGTHDGRGIDRLDEMTGRLGITGKPPTGGNPHVFLHSITTNEHFGEWATRIHEMPRSFVSRVCEECRKYGITKEEAEKAEQFLNYRKWTLRGLMNRWKDEFTGISSWPLL